MLTPHQNAPAIKCLLARLHKGNLIVPFNLLAELVGDAELSPATHPGLAGWLNWRNRNIPVVALEALCMDEEAAQAGNGSCLILHTVSPAVEQPFIGLRVQGGLNTLEILPDTLRDDHSGNVQRCPYVARQVRVSHLLCLIPDLPAIEAAIAEILQLGANP